MHAYIQDVFITTAAGRFGKMDAATGAITFVAGVSGDIGYQDGPAAQVWHVCTYACDADRHKHCIITCVGDIAYQDGPAAQVWHASCNNCVAYTHPRTVEM